MQHVSNPITDFLDGQARSISELLDRAENAPPVEIRYAGGDRENPRVSPAPPPMASISLNREMVSAAARDAAVTYAGLQPGTPGNVVKLGAEVMRQSAFCRAGGHLVIGDPVPLALTEQADRERRDFLVEQPRQFRSITPLKFSVANAGLMGVFPPAPWPASGDEPVNGLTAAASSKSLMSIFGARVQLTRRQQATLQRELWSYELSIALAQGLALLADQVAFQRLENHLQATPWSWSWPASKGTPHANLKALIGTAGTGAQVRQDGALTYGGICPAELSPVLAGTLVGDFSRSALFVDDSITLVAKRDSVTGTLDVAVTAALRFEAPNSEDFFTKVSA